MHQYVTEGSFYGCRIPLGKYQVGRGKGHNLPENKDDSIIPGKEHTKRTTDIKECCRVLPRILYVKGIDHPDKRCDNKYIGKNQTQLVYLTEYYRSVYRDGLFP